MGRPSRNTHTPCALTPHATLRRSIMTIARPEMLACGVSPSLARAPARLLASITKPSPTALMLMAILAVAAYVRLVEIDLTWFMLDQSRDVRTARLIVQGRAFPLVGPAIEGGPSHTWGPLYFYLVAVPVAFSRDPTVAAAFLSLLNLLAVYLTYRFGAAFFGRDVGLIGAALFATYPLAVVSARAMWNLSPVPLCTVIFFYCLFAVVVHQRSRMVIPALLTLALAPQLHLATVPFAVVFVLALVIYRPRIAPGHLVLGVGCAVLVSLPYLVAVTSGGGQGFRTTVSDSLARISARPPGDVLGLIQRVFFASSEVATWMARRFGDDGNATAWSFLHRTESWLMLLGAAYPVWRIGRARAAGTSLRDPEVAPHGLLALWLWVPILILSVKRGILNHYYFDVLYPALFLAAAVPLTDLVAFVRARGLARGAARLRTAVLVFVLLLVVSQVAVVRRLLSVTAARGHIPVPNDLITWGFPGTLPDGDTMPMRHKKGIVAAVIALVGADPSAFYRRVHGAAFEELLQDKGAFFDWLSRTTTTGRPPAAPVSLHVAVFPIAGHDFRGPLTRRVGPFAVVAQTPFIDYSSWEYAHDGTSASPGAAWRPLRIPTRGVPDPAEPGYPPLFDWSRMPVLIRGVLDAPEPTGSIALVVSIVDRQGSDHRVEACWMNDAPLPPGKASRFYTPVASVAINSETVFNLSGSLRAGRNVVGCRIVGQGTAFDLDVYEIKHVDGVLGEGRGSRLALSGGRP